MNTNGLALEQTTALESTMMLVHNATFTTISANDVISNATSHRYKFCEPLRIPALIITAGLISTAIVIGNILVMQAIIWGSAKLFRPMYWFILHLSLSDLCVGIMLLWNYCLAAIFDIHNTMVSLSAIQGVWVTCACASVFGILLLAVDRYMQVVHRQLHRTYFTQWTVGFTILLAWLIPLCIFLLVPLVFNWSCQDNCRCESGKYISCKPLNDCSQVIPPFTKSYILSVLLYLYILLPIPVVVYSLIFIKARRTTQALRLKVRKRDVRLIRTLVVIMLVFFVTLFPTGIILIIDYKIDYPSAKLTDYAIYVFVLASVNSLANPILYIWRIPAIRISLQRRWRCCCGHRLGRPDLSTLRKGSQMPEFTSDPPSPEVHDHPDLNRRFFPLCGRSGYNLSDVSNNSTPLTPQRSNDKRPSKRQRDSNHFLELHIIPDRTTIRPTAPSSPLVVNSRLEFFSKAGNRQVTRTRVPSVNDHSAEERDVMLHYERNGD